MRSPGCRSAMLASLPPRYTIVRGSKNTLIFPPPKTLTTTLSRTRSKLAMVPPTNVAFAFGTGGRSGKRLVGSTAIESSVVSWVMLGWRGSIAPSALSAPECDTIADAVGGEACACACEAPVAASAATAILMTERVRELDVSGFTRHLDASHLPKGGQNSRYSLVFEQFDGKPRPGSSIQTWSQFTEFSESVKRKQDGSEPRVLCLDRR